MSCIKKNTLKVLKRKRPINRKGEIKMVKIGDKIKIISENENYNEYRDKTWIVEDIATSIAEHPGYDAGVGG